MTRYISAIDQGTTSSRFVVFDRAASIVVWRSAGAARSAAARLGRGTTTWTSSATPRAMIAEALSGAGLAARDLAAIGITNQRETTLLWDRATGEPVHNAVVWQDTRVDPLVAAYARDGGQDRFRAQTGLPLASYFSALKLRWLLDNVPGARSRANAGDLAFGTIDAWLVWHLGGKHLTDVTNASLHPVDEPRDAGLGP